MKNEKIRNVAIIAHVDHGKTSLVNELLKQGGVFKSHQDVSDRVMDNNAIERERGITILSKNASCMFGDVKINIVDTPGHADFGGEVERVLKMVDGVLLVIDSFEGPMPQTRFVLQKALELGHKVIVVVNKIDRKDARIDEVKDEVLELLLELDATPEQLDSPFVYASAREGVSTLDMSVTPKSFVPLFRKIVEYIPGPEIAEDKPFTMLASSTEQNDFLGKLAVGKIESGKISTNMTLKAINFHDANKNFNFRVANLFLFDGLGKVPVTEAGAGDIICIAGGTDVAIGDTICDKSVDNALPFVNISAPSIEMTFSINNGPFAGKEGKFCTSRHLKDRLEKAAIKDLSLKVLPTDSADAYRVLGRGEMHISILVENMRRDGYEFMVSVPKVLYKTIDGKQHEPIDRVFIDVPTENVGSIMSEMGERKGELVTMDTGETRTKCEFLVPSRGLLGYKTKFLTDTRGNGIMNSLFEKYEPFKGYIRKRDFGALIAHETGEANSYGLFAAQERGKLLILPGTQVYAGMVVGKNPAGMDLTVNVCKKKQLTNIRSSGADDALKLVPVKLMSLEECIEFLDDDELLEVTPKNLRIRKTVLDHTKRIREKKPQ
ncbi:MAG: translational GTPase TypA [Firmicutes bacterium]|nr:translational GTPase TypA [Bacillota bacterium]